jgi:hypothetical protein
VRKRRAGVLNTSGILREVAASPKLRVVRAVARGMRQQRTGDGRRCPTEAIRPSKCVPFAHRPGAVPASNVTEAVGSEQPLPVRSRTAESD